VAYPGIFSGGDSTNSVEKSGQRERGSGGGSENRILIRLLRIYFPRNWEFVSALSKLRNFGVGGV
jgi:hypothetical protein